MTPLGALPTAPGCVREHVRSTLAEWGMSGYTETAELLASELMTNAVEASTDERGHPIYVNGRMAIVVFRMLAYPHRLVLEVWDLVAAIPAVRHVEPLDERGRGLFLVDTLAVRWSYKVVPDWPGKCVWAEIGK